MVYPCPCPCAAKVPPRYASIYMAINYSRTASLLRLEGQDRGAVPAPRRIPCRLGPAAAGPMFQYVQHRQGAREASLAPDSASSCEAGLLPYPGGPQQGAWWRFQRRVWELDGVAWVTVVLCQLRQDVGTDAATL